MSRRAATRRNTRAAANPGRQRLASELFRYWRQYIVQEFASGRDVDQIFDDLEDTCRRAEQKEIPDTPEQKASETSDFPVNLPVSDPGHSVLNLATEHDR
jgi:hypothetical protein